MAGDWIKMRCDLHDDPAVIAIAAATGLDEYAVVGRLHRLWSWASNHTRQGAVRSITTDALDVRVCAPGFSKALQEVDWLRVTDDEIVFPKFNRHNSKSAKKRALARDRMKRKRCAPKRTHASPEKRREEKILKTENADSGEPAEPASPPSVAVLSFPIVGDKSQTEWALTADMLSEHQTLYPGIDVLAESRKALAWVKANPSKRKTPKGMPAFLVNWLNRATNQGGPNHAGPRNDVGRDSRVSSPEGKYAGVTKRLGETPPGPGGGEAGRPGQGPQSEADRPAAANGNPFGGFG